MGVRDAKARFSQLVHDAERGREWVITERGKAVARIVSVQSTDRLPLAERLGRLERSGIVDAQPKHVLRVPPPLALKRGLARKMLERDRNA